MTKEELIDLLNIFDELVDSNYGYSDDIDQDEQNNLLYDETVRRFNEKYQINQELDEAAEEYKTIRTTGYNANAFDNALLFPCDLVLAFKAGAKWMEEQGIICEGRVSSQQGKRGIITTDVINDIGELMVADKVIVQIRKKKK